MQPFLMQRLRSYGHMMMNVLYVGYASAIELFPYPFSIPQNLGYISNGRNLWLRLKGFTATTSSILDACDPGALS